MTQNEKVLAYIVDRGGITQLEAIETFGITRLSARAWDIQHKMGIPLRTESVQVKNRFGETCTVTRYSLS